MQNTKPEQITINYSQQDVTNPDDVKVEITKGPNEDSGIHVSGHVRIFDPNTKEEFVNKREDG